MIDPFSILVADDDPEDQEILKEYLLGKNPALSIHCVYNGKEALSILNSLPGHELPSLIILDYKTPVLNAVQTLQEMAKNKRYAAIPKVVWSTSDREQHKKACLEAGAAYFFVKPCRPVDLSDIAGRLLEILANEKANKR